VRCVIDPRNVNVMLRSLATFLRHLGHRGLVVILDELELIREQSRRVRDSAYESLRLLTDNPYVVPSYVFLGAATREMFLPNMNGFDTYQPLYQRFGLAFLPHGPGEPCNWRGTVIDLERTPLTEADLRAIAVRLRVIDAIAGAWDAAAAVPDAALDRLVQFVSKTSGDTSKPRWLIATLVDVLQKKQQDAGYDVLGRIPEAARTAASAIRLQEQRRHRKLGGEA
jgi:hypothetical protein